MATQMEMVYRYNMGSQVMFWVRNSGAFWPAECASVACKPRCAGDVSLAGLMSAALQNLKI